VTEVRVVPTEGFSPSELSTVRELLLEAFEGDVTEDDWNNCLGGLHVVALDEGIVSHAAVVPRRLVSDRPLRSGYVEGVATALNHRHRGYGSSVMRVVADIVRDQYELGALATGSPGFYARLGWESWRGPTSVSTPTGLQRTPEEDDAVMVLRTAATRDLDVTTGLMCEWRPGEVW
jgi:aminoglycoside 2'-N-acetyltransferase I